MCYRQGLGNRKESDGDRDDDDNDEDGVDDEFGIWNFVFRHFFFHIAARL